LNSLYKVGYLICIGDKEHSYSVGELSVIDRIVAWITQMIYAQNKIEDQIAMFEDNVETGKFDDVIEEAEECIIFYQKLHQNPIAFFYMSD